MQFPEGINPIGDMDLRDGLFQRLYNALHREIASANSKGTPSTYADWIIGYHKINNDGRLNGYILKEKDN